MLAEGDINKIQLANVERLHFLLRPGNEKKLIPGLNRSGLFNKDKKIVVWFRNEDDTCFSHVSLNSLEKEWRLFFSTILNRKMTSIELLKLVAALLVIEPKWDITIGSHFDKISKKKNIRALLVAYKQERDSYECSLLAFKNACDVNIQQKNTEISTLDLSDELLAQEKLYHVNSFINQLPAIRDRIIHEIESLPCSIPRVTQLLDCLTQAVLEPTESNLALLNTELVAHSSLNIINGMLIGTAGLAIIAGGLIFSVGTFGVLFPLGLTAVYGGFYLLNLAIGLLGIGLGFVALNKGAGFFSGGLSIYNMKNSIDDCVRLVSRPPDLSASETLRDQLSLRNVSHPTITDGNDLHNYNARNSFFQLHRHQSRDVALSVRRKEDLPEVAQDFKAAWLPDRMARDFSFNDLDARTVYFEVNEDIDLIIYFKVCAAGYVDDVDGILISSLSGVGLELPITPDQLKNHLIDSGIILRRSELKQSLDNSSNRVGFNAS